MRCLLLCLALCLTSNFSSAQKAIRVLLPDYKGALDVRVDDTLWIQESQMREDGTGIRIAANGIQDVFITIFVQKATGPANPVEVRKQWWTYKIPNGVKRGKVEMSEGPGYARVDYLDESYNGEPIQQENWHQYFAGGGVWVEVHMSKPHWKPTDQKLFDKLLEHFELNPDYQPTSTDAWRNGSAMYVRQQYRGAAKAYQRALDLERQEPTLDSKSWHVLVDNLAMAYGITHDLKSAKQVLDYGILKDHKYPMFYYNLACVSGEQNDLDGTLTNLKLAFDWRANMLPGESMPDPMKDDSFRQFVSNKAFQEAVANLPKN
jgi:tetratricopeptide (TPR) repeat protein